MRSISTMLKGATLIIDHCLKVQAGEKVLIISDQDHRMEAEILAGLAYARGTFPVTVNITPQVTACMASMDVSMNPPQHLAEAMRNSDVIIITTVLEWANRFAHVSPVKDAVANNARVVSIEEGIDRWDLTVEDIDQIMLRTAKLTKAMESGKWVRVTSALGTDVRINIEGRPALQVVPVKEKGVMMGPIPLWGEVAYAAVEDKTEGVIMVDGIMLGVGVPGTLPEPIRWVIKNGAAVEITGGDAAEKLRKVVDAVGPNALVIGEFALGTSHKESYGTPSEKGLMGTAHFALGDNANCYPGGQNHCPLHLDGSVRDITVEVDGKVLIEKGKLVI
jgi:leucyl aminopeptidase (aminopeptidase T)